MAQPAKPTIKADAAWFDSQCDSLKRMKESAFVVSRRYLVKFNRGDDDEGMSAVRIPADGELPQ